MHYLEKDFNNSILPKKLDGIIILAGAIDPTLSNDYKTIEFNSSSERILKLLDFKDKPEIKKVFSGGGAIIFNKKLNQSDFAKQFYNKVELNDVIYENKSKNTYENIKFTYQLIDPKKDEDWIVITSAYHMKRVINIANSLGWKLHPLPVDFKTNKTFVYYKNIDPLSNLQIFSLAVREVLANFAYKLFLIENE